MTTPNHGPLSVFVADAKPAPAVKRHNDAAEKNRDENAQALLA